MTDYSNYYFKDLLEAIEEGCQKIGEKRDFIKYLLSMEKAESIEKLVDIYDNIYKLLFVFTYGAEHFPKDWYKPACGGYYKTHQVELLNRYFNDNILRLYNQYSHLTKEQIIPYISNLRVCINSKIIQHKILQKDFDDKDNLLKKLGNTRESQFTVRQKIEFMHKYDSRYPSLLQRYRSLSTMLAYYGRMFDVAEIAFAKEHGIDYNAMKVKYEKYLENKKIEEKEREQEEERQKRKIREARKRKKMIETTTAILITAPILFLIMYFSDYIKQFISLALIPAFFYLLGLLLLII